MHTDSRLFDFKHLVFFFNCFSNNLKIMLIGGQRKERFSAQCGQELRK